MTSLREIDAALGEVAGEAPDHLFSGGDLDRLLSLLAAVRAQYGSQLIMDLEISGLLIEHEMSASGSAPPPGPVTAGEVRVMLASVSASLKAQDDGRETVGDG
jgi:hypothetical protein